MNVSLNFPPTPEFADRETEFEWVRVPEGRPPGAPDQARPTEGRFDG